MKDIILWGTGMVASEVLNGCDINNQYNVLGVIDNDSAKWGKCFEKIQVYSPDFIRNYSRTTIVILSDYFDEIKKQIETEYSDNVVSIENKYFFYKEKLLKRYENNADADVVEIVSYIKKNGLGIFNYDFTKKYNTRTEVWIDDLSGLYYLIHKGKKMYFPRIFNSKDSVVEYYNSILMEQDYNSPHKYLSDTFNIDYGDIVIDVGVAEGNFALEVIDKVSKIYLIEADDDWVEALTLTFKDYAEKVVIIKAFVSSYCVENVVTIDSLIKEPVNFIKMDIEGNEWDALNGAKELIGKSKGIKLAVCSYHSDFDQELIEAFMDKQDIVHRTSRGYMWFPYTVRQTYTSTKLNRGIILGVKR